MAQADYELARDNVATTDTLYAVGEQRQKIAAISQADLLTLKLDKVNARNTLKNADEYRTMINSNVKNWDMDRIAFMDVVIMQTALAEILSFPTIPVSVSFNEYIELAKLYSTNQSAAFINGTLDGIVNQLKKDGKLIKK